VEILRLLPDQIMDHWHFISDAMRRAYPPVAEATNESMLRVQEQFLLGEMDCWFGVDSLNAPDIVAVMTTKVVNEEISGTKNMLIFSVTTYQPHNQELWTDGYNTLRAYALSKGCRKIISFSNDLRVLSIARQLGADVDWNLIQLDI
jgi:hypothetical protein